VHMPPARRRVMTRRDRTSARGLLCPGRGLTIGWITALSVATVAAVLGIGGSAGAAAQPTVAQVQKRLAKIDKKASTLGQQYDSVLQQLSQADKELKLVDRQTAQDRRAFDADRREIEKLAAVDYEQGGVDSPIGLLTSSSPGRVLSEVSLLNALSVADGAQIREFLAASRALLSSQRTAARTRLGILKLKRSTGKRLAVLRKLKQKEENLLALLTPAQRAGIGPGGGTTTGAYKGATATQAEKAVAYVYDQLGCPYVYGGTGPCADGFDCSGLVMEAWAAAGLSIERTSYEQMAEFPAVPITTSTGAFTDKYLKPGDILGFLSNGHVGLYVGGGYLIDAPQTGQDVQKVALSGWYVENLDGAVRP
jgi:peptidoglycan DL-endopeptidase CwlO